MSPLCRLSSVHLRHLRPLRRSLPFLVHRPISSTSSRFADPFAALDATKPPPAAPRTVPLSSPSLSSSKAPNSAFGEFPEGNKTEIGLEDAGTDGTDWSSSFNGLSEERFSDEVVTILMAPLDPADVEIKPDGIIYLPEIKYRRILNRAFGPGGWGLAPRSPSKITPKNISREYALICQGRLVSLARGEQDYFGGPDSVATATEGCKSNALMRLCKDLGVASELWDPNYIVWWKKTYATQEWVTGALGKKRNAWSKKRNANWKPAFLLKAEEAAAEKK